MSSKRAKPGITVVKDEPPVDVSTKLAKHLTHKELVKLMEAREEVGPAERFNSIAYLDKYHTRAEIVRLFGPEKAREWYAYDGFLQHNRTAFVPFGLPSEIAHRRTDP